MYKINMKAWNIFKWTWTFFFSQLLNSKPIFLKSRLLLIQNNDQLNGTKYVLLITCIAKTIYIVCVKNLIIISEIKDLNMGHFIIIMVVCMRQYYVKINTNYMIIVMNEIVWRQNVWLWFFLVFVSPRLC